MGPEHVMHPAPFSLALYLIVRVYDTTDLTAATLMESRRAMEDVLRSPHVRVVWRTCPAGRASTTRHDAAPGHTVTDQADCERPLDSQELVMRITTARPETAPDWLGYSYVDTARTGLMRPDWMAPPQPNDWLLSRLEAERVQRGLIARTATWRHRLSSQPASRSA